MTDDLEQLKKTYLDSRSQGGDAHATASEALYAASIALLKNNPSDDMLLFLAQPEFKELDQRIHTWLKQQNREMQGDTGPTDFRISPGGILIPKDKGNLPSL